MWKTWKTCPKQCTMKTKNKLLHVLQTFALLLLLLYQTKSLLEVVVVAVTNGMQ